MSSKLLILSYSPRVEEDAVLTAPRSALGDLSGGCASAGSHYNPFAATHGSRSDTVRHVGDLGNIQTDKNGVADFEFEDAIISLNGPLSVVGRTVMVHTVRHVSFAQKKAVINAPRF
jgi:hypothetical protein